MIRFNIIARAIEITISRKSRKEIIRVTNVAIILQLAVFANDLFFISPIQLTPKGIKFAV